MPPTIRKDKERQAQGLFVNPQKVARAVATGQQGGLSGQIPGTESDPTQVGLQWSTIQQYPADADGPTVSPQGDQIAGVGHAALNNDGNPVFVTGNLAAPASDNHDAFQDGAAVVVDADGNHPAGYSQSTGPWGFWANVPPVLPALNPGTVGVTTDASSAGFIQPFIGPTTYFQDNGFEDPTYAVSELDVTAVLFGATYLQLAPSPSSGWGANPWVPAGWDMTCQCTDSAGISQITPSNTGIHFQDFANNITSMPDPTLSNTFSGDFGWSGIAITYTGSSYPLYMGLAVFARWSPPS